MRWSVGGGGVVFCGYWSCWVCAGCCAGRFWGLGREAEGLKSAYGESIKGGGKKCGDVRRGDWRQVAEGGADMWVAEISIGKKKTLNRLENMICRLVPKKTELG